MTISNEFYLTKNEKLNFLGEVLEENYQLNCFDGLDLSIKFNSKEDLLSVPFKEPKEFIKFLSNHWDENILKNFLKEDEYIIDGIFYSIKGEQFL